MFNFVMLILLVESTVGYMNRPIWKLAFNIHGSDGHQFGYTAKAWEDKTDVGTDSSAFTADYKSYDVTIETANFVAIARHQNGKCEAARVWQFLKTGKSLQDYLNRSKTTRLKGTHDKHIYSFISKTIADIFKDPIFSAEGGLVFNWLWGNNGVRIGNSKTAVTGSLPAKGTGNDDYFQGLGNTYYVGRDDLYGFDVSVTKRSCKSALCKVQGKDHGSHMKDGKLYGQYAIYISDDAKYFPCKNISLDVTMWDLEIDDFERIDGSNNGFITYDEVVFALFDVNNDGLLSLMEYSKARVEKEFGQTAYDPDVAVDFERIDKDGDGSLKFREVVFDAADADKDGKLSIYEFSKARLDSSLSEAR